MVSQSLFVYTGLRVSVSDVMVVLHIHMHTLVLREPHEEPPLTGLPPRFVTPRTLINISAPALVLTKHVMHL